MKKRIVQIAMLLYITSSACTNMDSTEATQINGTWVFNFEDWRASSMLALSGGELTINDDCLEMNGALVVWRPGHLELVEELVVSVQNGESRVISEIGGGLLSKGTKGDSLYPEEMFDFCSSQDVWEVASGQFIVQGSD